MPHGMGHNHARAVACAGVEGGVTLRPGRDNMRRQAYGPGLSRSPRENSVLGDQVAQGVAIQKRACIGGAQDAGAADLFDMCVHRAL